MTTILAQEPRADVTHELWLMASSGERHSLGILKSSRTTKSLGPADRLGLLKAGAKVGVSIEPSGGSPTGLPTSLIVASGDFLISPRFSRVRLPPYWPPAKRWAKALLLFVALGHTTPTLQRVKVIKNQRGKARHQPQVPQNVLGFSPAELMRI